MTSNELVNLIKESAWCQFQADTCTRCGYDEMAMEYKARAERLMAEYRKAVGLE